MAYNDEKHLFKLYQQQKITLIDDQKEKQW